MLTTKTIAGGRHKMASGEKEEMMVFMSVPDIFPDSSLREAVQALHRAPLPRPTVLSDDFFSYSVRDILDLPETAVKRQVRLLPCAGRKSAAIIFEIIEHLRKEFP